MALGHRIDAITQKCKQYLCNTPIPEGFYPSRIASQLLKEAERAKVTTANGVIVPSQYTFAITKEEYHKIEAIVSLLQARVLVCLDEELENRQYHTQGTLLFRFVVSESADKNITADPCTVTEETERVDESGIDEDCNLTRVFDKALPQASRPDELQAVVCVVEGLDQGKRFVFGDNRVNIGRRENNELVLTDKSVSRLHAYIIKEAGKHIVYDARSLNGTYLNEVRIVKQVLRAGDLIKVGNTILEYEIIQ